MRVRRNKLKPLQSCAGVFCLLFTGCASLPGITFERHSTADRIAFSGGLQKSSTAADPFTIISYYRIQKKGEPLHVYIEGDGLAWLSKEILSDDPTPMNPLALRLAALDPSPNVVYLARPCQYTMDTACDDAYWSGKRFSEPVIRSMNTAVTDFVARSAAKQVHLMGYSGGGAVAVLIAGRRDDVASIRTIAGDLDPQGLNRYHKVSPLDGSLDPMDAAVRVSHIPQRHFIGAADKRVPAFVAENFFKAAEGSSCIQITEVSHAEHAKGWEPEWRGLLDLPVECK